MSGKRVVFCTFGSLGDLYPIVALAREMKHREHSPIIATSPAYRKLVEAVFIPLFTTIMLAQDVQYNYDRDANFGAYKTYQWIEDDQRVGDQLLHQDIHRAIDSQLAQKGLQKVDKGADLYIRHGTAVDKQSQLDAWTMGPRWNGMVRGNTSTVEIGTLVLHIYDPAKKRLVWRGSVSKTLDVKRDPDKNYKNLGKAVSKLLRNYPPKSKS